ncbi:MAG: hypothetical protein ACR2QB_09570 [Gammaproteobacteria bacterium]
MGPIATLVHRLGGAAYRLAFFTAGCYLLWRSVVDDDATTSLVSLGLGFLCFLQFVVLAIIDYRRARQQDTDSDKPTRY